MFPPRRQLSCAHPTRHGRPPRREPVNVQLHDRRHSSPEHRAAYDRTVNAPGQHKPKLVTTHSVRQDVHGTGAVGRFNNGLAVVITKSVGTMWAAYLFTVIAVGGGVAVITGNAFWTAVSVLISQTFLQLVLLPIIIVGQNVISASQDARAEADHLTLTALHSMNVRQLEMLEQQRRILDQQHEILQRLPGQA